MMVCEEIVNQEECTRIVYNWQGIMQKGYLTNEERWWMLLEDDLTGEASLQEQPLSSSIRESSDLTDTQLLDITV